MLIRKGRLHTDTLPLHLPAMWVNGGHAHKRFHGQCCYGHALASNGEVQVHVCRSKLRGMWRDPEGGPG